MTKYEQYYGQATITTIEKMNEQTARDCAENHATIKGHDIYFVDFGGAFGFSMLVFFDGAHIYYANDYALHHQSARDKNELIALYIDEAQAKLFTDEELSADLASYDDEQARRYYLHNLYGLRRPHWSIFGNFNDPEYEKQYRETIKSKIYNPLAFAYYNAEDAAFIEQHEKLFADVIAAVERAEQSYNYWFDAIYYEMCNHEYCINSYQKNWDVFSCFGHVDYIDDDWNAAKYMDQLKWNDTQRKAFADAKKKYYKDAEANEWF